MQLYDERFYSLKTNNNCKIKADYIVDFHLLRVILKRNPAINEGYCELFSNELLEYH